MVARTVPLVQPNDERNRIVESNIRTGNAILNNLTEGSTEIVTDQLNEIDRPNLAASNADNLSQVRMNQLTRDQLNLSDGINKTNRETITIYRNENGKYVCTLCLEETVEQNRRAFTTHVKEEHIDCTATFLYGANNVGPRFEITRETNEIED